MSKKRQAFEFAWRSLLAFIFLTGFWFVVGVFHNGGFTGINWTATVQVSIILGCLCTYFAMLKILTGIKNKLEK